MQIVKWWSSKRLIKQRHDSRRRYNSTPNTDNCAPSSSPSPNDPLPAHPFPFALPTPSHHPHHPSTPLPTTLSTSIPQPPSFPFHPLVSQSSQLSALLPPSSSCAVLYGSIGTSKRSAGWWRMHIAATIHGLVRFLWGHSVMVLRGW